MDQTEKDAGTIAALMLRLEETRLPRAQRLLEKVNAGEKLEELDIYFLKKVYKDSRGTQALLARNPEYMTLVSKFTELYTEIINKGLENEKSIK